MIILIKILFFIMLAYTACQFIPGIKCLTSCKLKQMRFDKAVFDIRAQIINGKQDVSKWPKKKLIKLYKNSTIFGCKSLQVEKDITEAREILKNAIADKELLED